MPAKRKSPSRGYQRNPWVSAQVASQKSAKPARITTNVRKAVEIGFPDAVRPTVLAALRRYRGPESPRVYRALLALSGGNLKELNSHVDAANEDYRDVLYWAEYPDDSMDGTDKQKQVAIRRMTDRYRRLGFKVPKPD